MVFYVSLAWDISYNFGLRARSPVATPHERKILLNLFPRVYTVSHTKERKSEKSYSAFSRTSQFTESRSQIHNVFNRNHSGINNSALDLSESNKRKLSTVGRWDGASQMWWRLRIMGHVGSSRNPCPGRCPSPWVPAQKGLSTASPVA